MKRQSIIITATLVLSLFVTRFVGAQASIPLAGEWRFAMDREDVGVAEKWFSKNLADKIKLPGILQSQGYGDDISLETDWTAALPRDMRWYLLPQYKQYTVPGNIKVPYLSQPPKHYLGVAWYQRDIDVPQAWQGKNVHLFLERPRWQTTVFVDDKEIGSNNSLCAPHEYDLGAIAPGQHRLSIRADTRLNIVPGYRKDGHSVSDALGYSWNGIAGNIALSAVSPVWIADAQVFPNVEKKSALVKVQIGNITGQAGAGTLQAGSVSVPVRWDSNGGSAEIEVPLGNNVQTWDEFHPVLQHLTVALTGGSADDQKSLSFGLREIKAEGIDFVLNGKVINLRGTHYGGDFPLTGYPATDVASWKKIIQTCKDYGLNHMRFHSWCPPDAAFQAADELGFYLAPECGMWNPFSPGSPMSKMLEDETARIMHAYGNHPSFLLLSATNETSGNWVPVLNPWAANWYKTDPRRLYCTNTGRSNPRDAGGAQYASTPYRSNSGWFGRDFRGSLQGNIMPDIAHEVGQWCAYPDFNIINKMTGYLQPKNYEIFRDSAEAHGVLAQNKEFTYNSGKFQLLCYKEEIEANLRTPGAAGFQLLDLHDYLGQGGALVGVLDPFWESKGYVTPAEFRRFCNTTVPLARMLSSIYKQSDPFAIAVELAHYGPAPIKGAQPVWKIVDLSGKVAAQGRFDAKDIDTGKNIALGTVKVDLNTLAAPQQYKLVVGLEGTQFENDWNFWVYPAQVDTSTPADILITSDWNAAKDKLAAGGKVLFTPPLNSLDDTSPPLNNVPVFWNRLMNPGLQAMMGLLINPQHPALSEFPTQTWCDWEWTDAIRTPAGAAQAAAQAAAAAAGGGGRRGLGAPATAPTGAAARGGGRGAARGAAGFPATGPATAQARGGAARGRGFGGGGAAPAPAYIRAINLDKTPMDLRPIVQAIDDWNRNYRLAVVFEVKVGTGRLMVSAPDMSENLDARIVARQLRRSLLDYMSSDKFQPPVSMTVEQVSALWPGRSGPTVAPAPQALPGDIIENPVGPRGGGQ
jgi:hypothetical protein